MLYLKRFKTFLFVFVLIFLISGFIFAKTVKYAYVKYPRLNFRAGPSTQTKIIAKLNKGTKIKILKETGDFYYAHVVDSNLEGYVYKKGLYRFETINLPDYNVRFEFNAINGSAQSKILEFKRILNFDFYKKDVKIIFSYEPEFNVGRVFIETYFNKNFYDNNKEVSLKNNQIDLYPFLKFTSVYKKFLREVNKKYKVLGEFLDKFVLNIFLKKSRENFIILECYKKNKLYLFKPYIFLKKEGFRIIKITSDDKEIVERSYIFSLGPPYLSDGSKTIDSLLYDFFNINY